MTTNITEPSVTSADSVSQDALRDLYADWAEIMAATPDLTMRLFRAIFDEWHQPTIGHPRDDQAQWAFTAAAARCRWQFPVGFLHDGSDGG